MAAETDMPVLTLDAPIAVATMGARRSSGMWVLADSPGCTGPGAIQGAAGRDIEGTGMVDVKEDGTDECNAELIMEVEDVAASAISSPVQYEENI